MFPVIMDCLPPFVDIHCHLLPGLDDGPAGEEEAVSMARLAAAEGIGTVIVTPHQSGNYPQNTPERIRQRTDRLQHVLDRQGIHLHLLPGADIRVEPDLAGKILAGQALTLADRGRYVLLELPPDVYIPLDRLLDELHSAGMVGILSHPERNRGILHQPRVLRRLFDQGCLFQITAGSLSGCFGSQVQKFSQWLLKQELVHFIGTDAHGITSRPPVLRQAFQQVAEWFGRDAALDLCCRNPAMVAAGTAGIPRAETRRSRRRPDHRHEPILPEYAFFSHLAENPANR
jgi:protein-tyrosine phosphatase